MNEYFKTRVLVTDEGCWEWQRYRHRGLYGQLNLGQYKGAAHRYSYMVHIGPIPAGLTVDHLCFNPPCVNPDHLRLLTHADNAANQRDAYKTHCIRGHEYTPENTYLRTGGNGKRECKTCHRDRQRGYHAKARGQAA